MGVVAEIPAAAVVTKTQEALLLKKKAGSRLISGFSGAQKERNAFLEKSGPSIAASVVCLYHQ